MNERSRRLLALGAGGVLGLALLSYALWPSAESSPPRAGPAAPARSGDRPPSPSPAPSSEASASGPLGSAAAGAAPAATSSQAPEAAGASSEAMPSLELEHPLPQQNDPIQPELPQTAEWKHGKLVRITELLTRDVERLETELKAARGRGDKDEAQRLEVQIARHRARLGTLREETAAMAKAAQEEAKHP